ncbi:MAG: DNA replication and repair protein RecF [Bacteroidota bacterium]
MQLQSLHVRHFRSYAQLDMEWTPGINVLSGPNGIGKTNILEAIYYLCLTKSFLTSSDRYVLQRRADFCQAEGTFKVEGDRQERVRVVYQPGEGKRAFINKAPLDRLFDIVGRFPVVVHAPDDYALTAGGPEERRRFFNNMMSQARPSFGSSLLKYRRVLQQRNGLLQQMRKQRELPSTGLLESWNVALADLGGAIAWQRHQFIQAFATYVAQAFAKLDIAIGTPELVYATYADHSWHSEADATHALREALDRAAERERVLGRTAVGPHRDEVAFKLDGFPVRNFASQGQHRMFGLALKLAQFFYLKAQLERLPILLLDDVFATLDAERTGLIINLLTSDEVGQSFITTALPGIIAPMIDTDASLHQHIHLPLDA